MKGDSEGKMQAMNEQCAIHIDPRTNLRVSPLFRISERPDVIWITLANNLRRLANAFSTASLELGTADLASSSRILVASFLLIAFRNDWRNDLVLSLFV